VACSIIAVLIGLLLPAIQKKREEYAANQASANLTALLVASNEYFRQTGSYPRDIDQLAQFCQANPGSCSLDPELATGRKDGYFFELLADFDGDGDVDGADFLAVAEPQYPGITGSVTLTIDQQGLVTRTPTPGADEAREQMFNRIRAKAAETVVKLLGLDPSATSEVRRYSESPDTVANVQTLFDIDGDGLITLREINVCMGDGSVRFAETIPDDRLRNPVEEFFAYVRQEMKFDTMSEEAQNSILVGIGNIGVASDEQPPLFSYDGLCILTNIWINQDEIPDALCEKLEVAEAAEASGDLRARDKSIKSYQKGVKAQTGKTITRNNAKTLITFGDILISH
jgi:hypothetical protein